MGDRGRGAAMAVHWGTHLDRRRNTEPPRDIRQGRLSGQHEVLDHPRRSLWFLPGQPQLCSCIPTHDQQTHTGRLRTHHP